jgi:hypothetical protein
VIACLLIALILCIVVFVLLMSYIHGEFYFSRVQHNDRIFLDIKALFGLIRYRFDVPVVKFKSLQKGVMVKAEAVKKGDSSLVGEGKQHINKERIVDFFNRVKLILESTFHLYGWMKQTLAKVECTKVSWQTRIGVGDAPQTAITTGIVWGFKSSLLGFVFSYIRLRTQPHIQVFPQYNSPQFSTEATFAGRIRLGYALIAGIRLVISVLKVKGGFKNWYKAMFKPKVKSLT